MRRFLSLLAASAFLCAFSYAQDPQPAGGSQSLGDIARQLRLKKQQKEAQAKPAPAKEVANNDTAISNASDAAQPKTPHVLTNDDAPEQAATSTSAHHATGDKQQTPGDHEAQGEQWKSQIFAQKNAITSLQQEIASLSNSIHFAGGNCISNCEKWNERQQQKQQEVETMKAQLEEQQKHLEEMQDTARKQGFGSAIYDP
ncbi:MAG TPA: hypothetical protein VE377_12990 [Candidatus Dormibacteraeota bacterium]|nr:hypothetical protein [Candidatus Dormibacteraeota bacterium]